MYKNGDIHNPESELLCCHFGNDKLRHHKHFIRKLASKKPPYYDWK